MFRKAVHVPPLLARSRRAALGATVLSLAVVLAACGGNGGDNASDSKGDGGTAPSAQADPDVVALLPQEVKDKGTLTVGTEAQYPPMEFYDTDNKTIIGMDPDIAEGVASLMGLELSLKDAAFDSIIPSLASGRYDLGMSSFTITAERQKQVDFVSYFIGGDGLLVKQGNPKDLTIDESLCGVKVAVLKGSTQDLESVPMLDEKCSAAGKPKVAASVVPGSNDLGLALQSGRVDGVLTDNSNAADVATKSNGKMEVASGPPFNPAPFGIASQKDSGMAKAVQKALEKMVADGSYQKILDKWGMKDSAIKTPEINGVSG
jgi:polar amino acid transport system substrate-binding protein